MTWIRLDDQFPDHPKHVGISDAATALWARGLAYCSRHLTDGHIPAVALPSLTRKPAAVAELVDRNLWRVTPKGWRVVNYRQHQRSRSEVESERESGRERQKRWRASRRDNGVTNGRVTQPETETETETELPPKSPTGGLEAVLEPWSACPTCEGAGLDPQGDRCGCTRAPRAVGS